MTISYDILHKSKNDVKKKEPLDYVRSSNGVNLEYLGLRFFDVLIYKLSV